MKRANRRLAVELLGPLVVTAGGRPIDLRPGRLRTIAAVLALSAGRTVSVDRLAVAVWADDLPENVRGTVQNYVWRLRGLLGPDSIGTHGDGYALRVAPDDVDALRFDRLVDAAGQAGDPATERARLGMALALWRGNPFDDVRSATLEQVEASRLVERYLTAVERRVDLAVAEGNGADLVPQLRELTAQHPLRESLWARLLVVLDRCGRPAEALERYETIRGQLADELGVDPGPELRGIHIDLLARTYPEPAGGGDPSPGQDTAWQVIPRQLPAGVDTFTGRDQELATLDSLLGSASDAMRQPVVITVIAGTAGVGKSSLAVYWAHRVSERFPDGQLYASLRGFDPHGRVTEPADAVRRFLDALHVPAQQIPAAFEAQVGLFRSLLASRRVLVVLDNARDADQVRPLLPGSSGCVVVITSRNPLLSLVAAEGAHPITLNPLTTEEARQMLARRLGAERVASDPQAVDEIITASAQLPLALAVVAARAATQPSFGLAHLAAQLRDTRDRLDALTGPDPVTDVRTVFSWSYDTLSDDAARLFRLLGLLPQPCLTAPAAASLAGLPAQQARPLLTELAHASLMVEHNPGRYALHDLLRAYATELADTHDTDIDRRSALHRILDHYLHTAHTAAMLVNPERDPIILDPAQSAVSPEPLADRDAATTWLTAEHLVLLAVIEYAAANGFHTHTGQLTWTLLNHFDRRGHWRERVAIQHLAVDAARALNNPAEQARAHRDLGHAYIRLGQHDDAQTHLRHALDLYRQLDDHNGAAHTYRYLAWVCEREGRYTEALHHADTALDLYRQVNDTVGEADALNAVGWLQAELGDHQRALDLSQQALTLVERIGNPHGLAATWKCIGYAHHHLHDHDQAITCYERALTLYRDIGDRKYEADTLGHLGDTHQAAGSAASARHAWQQALDLLTELDHPDAEQIRAKIHSLDTTTAPIADDVPEGPKSR